MTDKYAWSQIRDRIKIFLVIAVNFVVVESYAQAKVDTACIPTEDTLDGNEVLKVVEKMSEYPGGLKALYRDFFKKLNYPKEQKDIQTKIHITFIVDTSGQMKNACIYKKFSEKEISSLERVSLEVIKSMPNWTPGEQNGKKVPVRIMLPMYIEVR